MIININNSLKPTNKPPVKNNFNELLINIKNIIFLLNSKI